jgi:hypothetical protein
VVAVAAAALAVRCVAPSGTPGTANGDEFFASTTAAVVTVENLSHDPPRVLGLVSADHPAAGADEAMLRGSGIKRIPPERMERLLEVLEDEGFAGFSAPLAEFAPVDSALVLRRLTVSIGDQRRAFTLPRRPSAASAERFNRQALAVQAMFNETVDFRQEVGSRDPGFFYDVARLLSGAGGAGSARRREEPSP